MRSSTSFATSRSFFQVSTGMHAPTNPRQIIVHTLLGGLELVVFCVVLAYVDQQLPPILSHCDSSSVVQLLFRVGLYFDDKVVL